VEPRRGALGARCSPPRPLDLHVRRTAAGAPGRQSRRALARALARAPDVLEPAHEPERPLPTRPGPSGRPLVGRSALGAHIPRRACRSSTRAWAQKLVRMRGLEPPRLAALEPKSSASASSATSASALLSRGGAAASSPHRLGGGLDLDRARRHDIRAPARRPANGRRSRLPCHTRLRANSADAPESEECPCKSLKSRPKA
jgi:hypothetical protein